MSRKESDAPARPAPRNVALRINDRRYTVACAPGEEARLHRLAARIEERIARHGGGAGQSEVRTLLYAALLLADEALEADEAAERAQAHSAALALSLETVASRLENLAGHLEASLASP